MKKVDALNVTGSFNLKVYDKGVLVREISENNLVVLLGKKNTARLLGGHTDGFKISKVQAGTDGTNPSTSDVAITNPFTKSLSSVTYPNDNQVTFNWILESGEANGMTIEEFGLLNNDNVLFARKIHTPIIKVSPMVIVGAWTITIN